MVDQEPGAPSHGEEEPLLSESLPVGGIEWPPDIGGGPPDQGMVQAETAEEGPFGEPPSGGEVAPWEDAGGRVFPDTRFGRFDRRVTMVAKWMSYLAGAALFVVVAFAFGDVIGWKFFHKPIPDQHDLIGLLNIALVFLAIFYGQMDRGATAIELIQKHLPRWLKVSVRTFGGLLGFASCELLAWRGVIYLGELYRDHAVTGGAWHIPQWPFEVAFVLGFFCMGLAFVMTTIRDLIHYRNKTDRYAPGPKKAKKAKRGATPAVSR